MKKIISLVLVMIICAFAFCSCSDPQESDTQKLNFGKQYDAAPSQLDVLLRLNAKSVDVGIMDSVMAKYYTSGDSEFANSVMLVDGVNLTTEQYGIAARKGSAIIHNINVALAELSKSGRIKTLAQKYGLENDLCIDGNYSAKAPEDTSDFDYIKQNGKMVIGYTIFEPIAFEENGELVGFDIELAKEVCDKLGVEAEFVVIDWPQKEALLSAKTIDCIWNGLTINDERKAAMEISIPYLNNKQVAVIRKEDAELYKSTDDMSDAIISAESGSAGEDCIVSSEENKQKASFWEITLELLGGFSYTLIIFLATLILAIPLGLVVSFGSMSKIKPLRYLTKGFVWIIRGTPLMLQIIVFSLGPGLWLGLPIRSTMAKIVMACVAFIINYACYFSEIYRGGIESIPKGQYEACQVLGMTKKQAFSKVVLLQVIKRIVAPMSNEIITLVKDTSLASVVISVDIIFVAEKLVNKYVILWPLFYAGLFYLIFNGIISFILSKLEQKLDYFKA